MAARDRTVDMPDAIACAELEILTANQATEIEAAWRGEI
jgi:hypothetical protein